MRHLYRSDFIQKQKKMQIWRFITVKYITQHIVPTNSPSSFFSNSEAFSSELLENHEGTLVTGSIQGVMNKCGQCHSSHPSPKTQCKITFLRTCSPGQDTDNFKFFPRSFRTPNEQKYIDGGIEEAYKHYAQLIMPVGTACPSLKSAVLTNWTRRGMRITMR